VLGSNACITPTNNLTIRPDATNSTPLAITGNSATEILDFNGGKYIKIDGRPGGTGSSEMLQIINTNAAAVATVRFINEAQNDTITFCDIQGQSTTSTSNPVTSAVILFAGTNVTVANGGTGNDNNGITYSDIHATSGGTPAIGIGAGITQTAGLATDNDNNTIYSCNIYDFFSATLATDGIKLDIGNNAWTISKCNFYETVPRSGSNAAANWFRFIHLNPNTSAASFSYGSGHTVTLNQFGGTNSSGTGTMLLTSSGAATMIGMDISVGNGTGTIVNGNTFQNITFTSTSTALLTGGTTGAMAMISVNYGNVTSISSNTINNMTLAPGSGGTFMGIRIGGGLGTITTNVINNNTISNISISPTTATNAGNFIGIDMNGGTTVEQITNN